jgi:hypothetical protein
MEQDAGHGLGKPTGKVIDELRDIYAFLSAIINLACKGFEVANRDRPG